MQYPTAEISGRSNIEKCATVTQTDEIILNIYQKIGMLQLSTLSTTLLVFLVALSTCSTPQTATQSDRAAGDTGAKLGPQVSASDPMNVMPDMAAPDWAPNIDQQMLAVIEQLTATEPPAYPELTPFQVRNAVLPAEAVAEVLMKTGLPAAPAKTDVIQKKLPVGPEEGLLVRMYKPLDAPAGPLPIIVYYHGGGWVIADLDTYEPSARALAAKSGAIVVSVAYRQAPEHTFPTAHEDSYAAYEWVTQNAASIGGDPERIATAGESAGGNLAVAVALMARDRGGRMPVHILSVYPIADGDVQSSELRHLRQGPAPQSRLHGVVLQLLRPRLEADGGAVDRTGRC